MYEVEVTMNTPAKATLYLATLIVVGAALVLGPPAEAAYLEDVPQVLIQPDGTRIDCFASGDEYYHWLHDADGFVIVRDPETGYWVWAKKEHGDLAPTDFVVGRIPPRFMDLEPRIRPDQKTLNERAASLFPAPPSQPAPSTGTMDNIAIFIRFSGESEFGQAISAYDYAFNSTNPGDSSMKAYFGEVSYTQLTINSSFYPTPGSNVVSYQDSHPRSYYQPYDATMNPGGYSGGSSGTERRDREHALLKNAVDAVSSQVPVALDVDGDDDGYVDNVVFIIKGSPDGWGELLWPHQWSLWSVTASINGARVNEYNFQLSSSLGVGVLCHEMFHSLGAPDLYHYTSNGVAPAYQWDVMENNRNPPQHMTMYMKKRYGKWVASIPEITASGTYSLNPTTSSTNNAYRIASPFTASEYFVVEYRRKTGTFESSVPGSGLIVYRINTAADGTGNRNGPPDELYVYRPGGSNTVNGTPSNAHFSLDVGRTQINDSTNPSSFLQDDSSGGLDISDVTSAGATISFTVAVSASDDFGISATPSSREVCQGADAAFDVAVSTIGSFTGPVTLGASGIPAGTTNGFSLNPVNTLPSSSTFTVGNTAAAAPGTSTITITGTGSPGSHNDTVDLTILTNPGAGSLQSPANGAAGVSTSPTFMWNAVAGATSYTITIATDSGFQNVVDSATVQVTNYSGTTLNADTTYHWRVFASNSCGPGTTSSTLSFTTDDGSTVCTSVLLEPGFEAGQGSAWSEYSSNGWPIVTADYPRTGTYSGWLGGGNNEAADLWQAPAINAAASSATLTYWYLLDSSDLCGYDFGGVEINGTPPSGHNYDLCTTTNTGSSWIEASPIDLLSLAGTSPTISFFTTTDESNGSSLFVDDVTLDVCVPGAAPARFSDGFESGDTSSWTSTVP